MPAPMVRVDRVIGDDPWSLAISIDRLTNQIRVNPLFTRANSCSPDKALYFFIGLSH
jgi:hypothetical protein